MDGSAAEQATVYERLASLRATAALDRTHPELVVSLLPWVLSLDDSGRLMEIFACGVDLLAGRYAALGLGDVLPTDRVWVGVRSSSGGWGGFHYPNQGYRHLQMGAIITRYGDLGSDSATSPDLVALDLLRSYAHDCLHYGTYRQYRLWDAEIARTRYGINARSRDGRTYSAPDADGTRSARNLGIVMEGATDQEAKRITRQAAKRVGVVTPEYGPDWYAFRDVTGRLSSADLVALHDRSIRSRLAQGTVADAYLARMGSYARDIGSRYTTFLREIGRGASDDLHTVIVRAMVSGSLVSLSGSISGTERGRSPHCSARRPTRAKNPVAR
ncbi:hypothetical protein AB0M95_38100 [Sphaerisporangium sp. NPDC051017]|uniref:hypothetical protein n=1 Tax=Sphaerisporangium sp. NPDC051017 TaxID=3154636 RepID=UPI003426431C